MSEVVRTEVFDCDRESIYNILVDYESYPQFMDGVDEVRITEVKGEVTRVEYHLNLIKKFSYTIDITANGKDSISWEFVSGDLFKSNAGSWTLRELDDGKTEVTYKLDLGFKVLVPKMVSNKLAAGSLPAMMKSVEKRAQSYGRTGR